MRYEPNPFWPGDENHITIVPYVEQHFAQETLALLWKRAGEQYIPSYVWSDGQPVSLNTFVRNYGPESGRTLFLAVHAPPDTEHTAFQIDSVIGFMWVDNVQNHRADAHFFFYEDWRGEWTVASAKKMVSILFNEPFNLSLLICRTNSQNRLAVAFAKRCGATIIGEIPKYYKHGNNFYNATIGHIVKDDN